LLTRAITELLFVIRLAKYYDSFLPLGAKQVNCYTHMGSRSFHPFRFWFVNKATIAYNNSPSMVRSSPPRAALGTELESSKLLGGLPKRL
jgi:hypothetical protein